MEAAEVRRLGYKLRVSPSCLPSMLITGKGCTIAFLLLDDDQSKEMWERCGPLQQLHDERDVMSCSLPLSGTGVDVAVRALLHMQSREASMCELTCRIDRVHSKGFPNAFVVVTSHGAGTSSVSDDAMLRAVCR